MPINVVSFGNRVFVADYDFIWLDLNPMGQVFLGNKDIGIKTLENAGEDWSYAAASQAPIRSQERGLEQTAPYCLQWEHGPIRTMILDW